MTLSSGYNLWWFWYWTLSLQYSESSLLDGGRMFEFMYPKRFCAAWYSSSYSSQYLISGMAWLRNVPKSDIIGFSARTTRMRTRSRSRCACPTATNVSEADGNGEWTPTSPKMAPRDRYTSARPSIPLRNGGGGKEEEEIYEELFYLHRLFLLVIPSVLVVWKA